MYFWSPFCRRFGGRMILRSHLETETCPVLLSVFASLAAGAKQLMFVHRRRAALPQLLRLRLGQGLNEAIMILGLGIYMYIKILIYIDRDIYIYI